MVIPKRSSAEDASLIESSAVTLAEEVRAERRRPIDLDTAARFLPLVARETPEDYDAWALRWLARWAAETGTATAEQAAEVTATLADLPTEPGMIDRLRL
jgi:hypothetical protein